MEIYSVHTWNMITCMSRKERNMVIGLTRSKSHLTHSFSFRVALPRSESKYFSHTYFYYQLMGCYSSKHHPKLRLKKKYKHKFSKIKQRLAVISALKVHFSMQICFLTGFYFSSQWWQVPLWFVQQWFINSRSQSNHSIISHNHQWMVCLSELSITINSAFELYAEILNICFSFDVDFDK